MLRSAWAQQPVWHHCLHPPLQSFASASCRRSLACLCLTLLWRRYQPAIRAGEWWRLFSSICLHGSFSHLFSNMLVFVVLAVPLEHRWAVSSTALQVLCYGCITCRNVHLAWFASDECAAWCAGHPWVPITPCMQAHVATKLIVCLLHVSACLPCTCSYGFFRIFAIFLASGELRRLGTCCTACTHADDSCSSVMQPACSLVYAQPVLTSGGATCGTWGTDVC